MAVGSRGASVGRASLGGGSGAGDLLAGVQIGQNNFPAIQIRFTRVPRAVSVRIVEVIPGKSFVGLEIPNENRQLVTLGEILKSRAYDDMASPLNQIAFHLAMPGKKYSANS